MKPAPTYMMAAICNGGYYGGGYQAAPYAAMDDGIMIAVLVKPISRIQVAGILANTKLGGTCRMPNTIVPEFRSFMTFYRARSVEMQVLDNRPIIATIDGECAPVMGWKRKFCHLRSRCAAAAACLRQRGHPWAARMPDAGKSKIKPWQTRQNKALIAVLEIKSAASWPEGGKDMSEAKVRPREYLNRLDFSEFVVWPGSYFDSYLFDNIVEYRFETIQYLLASLYSQKNKC